LRPSKRLSTLGETLPEVSSHRKMEPARLSALIRGDLDWIVMKALEKDRQRRYPRAEDFAADIERHLADRPVVARPPSVVYRFRKFLRRHKVAVGTTGSIAATLMLALVAGWMVGKHGRGPREHDKLIGQARDCLSREQYAKAAEAYGKALEWDRRVFGDDAPQTLSTMRGPAKARQGEQRPDAAADIYEKVLDGQKRVLGPTHSETRQTAAGLSWLYVRQSWELCVAGTANTEHVEMLAKKGAMLADPSDYVSCMPSRKSLAFAQFRNHHAEDALKSLEAALDWWEPSPWFLMAMVLHELRQKEDARVWYAVASDSTYESDDQRVKALAASSLALPDQWPISGWTSDQGIEACTKLVAKYPRVSWLFNRRAAYYARQGKWEQAASDYVKAVEILSWEPVHKLNLGVIYLYSGDLQRYAAVCRSAFQSLSANDGVNQNYYHVARIVLLCSLSPASQVDPRAANGHADRFLPQARSVWWMRMAKAIAAYRCGQYQETMRSLPREDEPHSRTLSRLVRAMARRKLGETREAQRILEIARREIRQELPAYNAPDRSRDAFMHLNRATTWCMVQTVLREAEQLIDPEHKLADTNGPGDNKQPDH
jgi:tetratricopeptide (TPR) repeat protein